MDKQRHKRDGSKNQQTSTAVRPPLPRDGSIDGQNNVKTRMPAGLITVWDFGNGPQTKNSPTDRSGRKVY